jgi:hypothetical protein
MNKNGNAARRAITAHSAKNVQKRWYEQPKSDQYARKKTPSTHAREFGPSSPEGQAILVGLILTMTSCQTSGRCYRSDAYKGRRKAKEAASARVDYSNQHAFLISTHLPLTHRTPEVRSNEMSLGMDAIQQWRRPKHKLASWLRSRSKATRLP